MDELTETIRSLINRIEAAPGDEQSIQTQALDHLSRLLAAVETGNRPAAERRIAQFHHFWLQRVPWCIPLSKDLEKLLIQLEERNT